MSETILGIDLGTTNSEVAIIRNGQPFVLPGDDGDPILPSCVGLTEDGKLLVGKAARNQHVLAPERTIKSIKRKMGQDVKVPLGNQQFTPQEISAMILRALLERARKHVGPQVKKAVITVPAFFSESQRQATRMAGELAGLEVVRILNEPTAASLTYDPHHAGRRMILVYDLGGGTFDVSIVQSEAGVLEVLASHGDTMLGGDDFDAKILDWLADNFQAEHDIDLRSNLSSKARLLQAAENAKKALSDHPFTRIEEDFIAEKDGVALHINTELNRDEYEEMIMPYIERTMDCVQQTLDDAKITAKQIDRVVLVGGSTRTPLISHLLESRLNQPTHKEVNPDLCVAMGAAIQGAIIAGQDIGAVLVDITPHSLGVKCVSDDPSLGSDAFAPILERNTALPASRSDVFFTLVDRQQTVEIDVYQGENRNVRLNTRVGKFRIEGLAPVPKGNPILVQLDMSVDGTLKVTAREKVTGLAKSITIENTLSRFSRDEREQAITRLRGLFDNSEEFNPEDDYDDDFENDFENETTTVQPVIATGLPEIVAAPREGQREAVQAKALLEKAERLMGQVSVEDRGELERLMNKVRLALTDRRWADLQEASNELSDILFYIEDA